MRKGAGLDVLVATDGSREARAAVTLAVHFPWPPGARVHGVVARGGPLVTEWSAPVWAALDRQLARVARHALRTLHARWPDAEVAVVDEPPVDAILSRAASLAAGAIVLGSRGYGAFGRFVLGSVSRGVVRRAACPVLVIKGRPRPVRRLVIGFDGSANARRAVALVATFTRPPRGRATLVHALPPTRLPSMGLLPASIRATLAGQAAVVAERETAPARQAMASAARELDRAGWRVKRVVPHGTPLTELLAAAVAARADLLVLGARGVGGVERLLLGSVAEAALTRAPIPVLVVK